MDMTEIAMPRLSDSMEEGTILKWLIAERLRAARAHQHRRRRRGR
jgi:hypothetical protein